MTTKTTRKPAVDSIPGRILAVVGKSVKPIDMPTIMKRAKSPDAVQGNWTYQAKLLCDIGLLHRELNGDKGAFVYTIPADAAPIVAAAASAPTTSAKSDRIIAQLLAILDSDENKAEIISMLLAMIAPVKNTKNTAA